MNTLIEGTVIEVDSSYMSGKDKFIQKQHDNQLVTDFRERFIELYDDITNTFENNVASKLDGATPDEVKQVYTQYDYLLKSLDNIQDAFVNLETGLAC